MKKDQVVILTAQLDAHANIVMDRINERDTGVEFVRLNTSDIPLKSYMTLDGDDLGKITLTDGNRIIDRNRVRSFWLRKPDVFKLPTDWTKRETTFATDELDAFLNDFFLSLNCYWINDPFKTLRADSKLEQLRRARRFGFSVPKTIATNDPDTVKLFFENSRKRIIFKVFKDVFLALHEAGVQELDGWFRIDDEDAFIVTKTTAITEAEIDLLNNSLFVPGIFQELVEKKYDLRVTIIGNRVFAARIHSQDYAETELDWRASEMELKYSVEKLPPKLEQQCIDYVKSYGLSFSSMDFIISKDDEYIFLESNTNGQFLFVELELPELKMADAVIRCLIEGHDV